ncbi:MAG: hypothetical protein ACOY3I_08395 [Verrucomicrobiota bacterium]
MKEKNKKVSSEKEFFQILATEMEAIQENALAQFLDCGQKRDLKSIFKQNFYDGFEEMIDYLARASGWEKKILSLSIKKGFQSGWHGKWAKVFLNAFVERQSPSVQRIAQTVETLTESHLRKISQIAAQSHPPTLLQGQYQTAM